jgi:hypothetical protein
LQAACSLTVAGMEAGLPNLHAKILEEGRTTKGVEAVLAHALRPAEDHDDPGLVYVSPELVTDVKNCKYGLGWDTSYRNCHQGISPFAVPYMSMKHQHERSAYQHLLEKKPQRQWATWRKERAHKAQLPKTTMDCCSSSPTMCGYS